MNVVGIEQLHFSDINAYESDESSDWTIATVALSVIVGGAVLFGANKYYKIRSQRIARFEEGLNQWIDASPTKEERANRQIAAEKMTDYYKGQYSVWNRPKQELSLNGLRLTSLPQEIGQLVTLRSIDLNHNRLNSFPRTIRRLIKLTELNLSYNVFTSVPLDIVHLTNLEILDLSHNQLGSIRTEIERLSSLKVLNLAHNFLTTLPRTFVNLYDLEELLLVHNRLSFFPDGIDKLIQLEILNLRHNRITYIHPDIISLKEKLKTLDLRNNHLKHVPDAILNLDCDAMIFLDMNPLSVSVRECLLDFMRLPSYDGPQIDLLEPENIRADNSTLEAVFKKLCQEAQINEPIELDHVREKGSILHTWLSRLHFMTDYKNRGQELALFIYQAISKAEKEKDFRNIFFRCLDEAVNTCGDSRALTLLKLDLNYEIEICKEKADLSRLAYYLGHGVWALSTLEEIARAKINSQDQVDEIAVYLGYPVKLKEALQLPIWIDSMQFFQLSKISDSDLQSAKKVVSDMLSDMDAYSQFLAENETWQEALQSYKSEAYNLLIKERDEAADYLPDDSSYGDYVAIGERYKTAVKQLTQTVLFSLPELPPFLSR